jgi:hypothetical protein
MVRFILEEIADVSGMSFLVPKPAPVLILYLQLWLWAMPHQAM